MVKVKNVVAAALMLCASAAMASNFRVSDQVYLLAGAHAGGISGTFLSDVYISNLSTDPVGVSLIYSSGTAGSQQTFGSSGTPWFVLQPNERREIVDFFGAPQSQGGLGLTSAPVGQVIFNGCKQGGNCDLTTCPGGSSGACPDFRNISIESRIYSIPPGAVLANNPPTNGQLFSGLPWYSFVSSDAASAGLDKAFITGLRNTTLYRSNLGFVNASQFSTTTLVIKLFNGATNAQIGSNATVTLAPLGHTQLNINNAALFPSFTGSTATNAFVTVEQTNTIPTSDAGLNGCGNGCPAFFAYGSVLDNQSGDATTLEPQYLKPLTDAAINCIYNLVCKGSFNPHRAVKH